MASSIPTLDQLKCKAKEIFIEEFDSEPTHSACAPGRVNLIGEHVDYCEGFVLPIALPLITLVVGAPAEGTLTTIITLDEHVDEPHKGHICTPKDGGRDYTLGKPKWLNYIKGILAKFKGKPPAFNAVIVSSVPVGGGLSSSAALEVAVYTFLEALCGGPSLCTKPEEKALLCMDAEHEYGQVPCGMMDQFIAVMGKIGHALLIDCKDKSTKQIPFETKNVVVLVTNSNVKHDLGSSEYPKRREMCEKAAKLLDMDSLRCATLEDIPKLEAMNVEKDMIKRVRHVITEIKRTEEAAEALKFNDFETFGKLMEESHKSLRDDFEVSCPEIDFLVANSIGGCGVYGSRMTGGGFGGCTVTLVNEKCAQGCIDHLTKVYTKKFDVEPIFYICRPSQGARIL